jgi:hypothetical protein
MPEQPTSLVYAGAENQVEFHSLDRVAEGLENFWPKPLTDIGENFETAKNEVLDRVRARMKLWVDRLHLWQIEKYYFGKSDGKISFHFEGPVTAIVDEPEENIFVTSDNIQPIDPSAPDLVISSVTVTFDSTTRTWDYGEDQPSEDELEFLKKGNLSIPFSLARRKHSNPPAPAHKKPRA